MLAQVKATHALHIVTAFGGREYIKSEWRPVPDGCEAEAESHPYLDVQTAVASEDDETELRATAKELGISNWWSKGLERLKGEIEEAQHGN